MRAIYKNMTWTPVKDHPNLRYTEQDGELIVYYHRSYIHTTWAGVELAVRARCQTFGKSKKPNPKTAKGVTCRIIQPVRTLNKKVGMTLFVKLVAEGVIRRGNVNCECGEVA